MTPEKFLTEALTWIGTPHEHGQRCKGAGVDCGQFLIGAASAIGLMPPIKVSYYPKDFHLHRDFEWYKGIVEEFCVEISPPPSPGDIVLYKQGRLYSHGGIVKDWPWIIHSYGGHGVIEAMGDQGRVGSLPRKFYRPKVFFGCEGTPQLLSTASGSSR